MEHGSNAYFERLYSAFKECGRHEMPELDGHWVTTESPARDVWICEGRIRWKAEWGGVSDICLSKVLTVEGGIDAEGAWHEDLHDPGDASGLYLFVRRHDGRLSIEAADWETPESRSQWFLLERKPDAAAHARMQCPLQ